MNRMLNKFPSQRKKKKVIWANGSITVKENVLIPIFLVDTLFQYGVVYLKLVYCSPLPSPLIQGHPYFNALLK